MAITIARLQLSSSAFEEGKRIPAVYTCEGRNINPPLSIQRLPEGTRSLALIVEDPDAPKQTFDHWVMWNIPVRETIDEDANPGINGVNSAGETGYIGPCPPSGVHRYYFHVFALDAELDLPAGINKEALLVAIESHVLARGSLMGTYEKKNKETE
ncbi:MAG: YbhB/YbcL family Raf kinase inhibitor-like protein [Candidatus Pseudobacter hemicellulosilyticus]|uniref:YbhB/YbcL family Raf kinase inhibitor-like protein n=1 Tax=Candidatus Pseudobacter hemicellulosilyticus TaxID=3121375 RepID=A0AAJ5WQ71_9BACT|nr:MAG: YbhB/YbcL family Raf kinase inhibitor-like protein [Pseudobacter sp.]